MKKLQIQSVFFFCLLSVFSCKEAQNNGSDSVKVTDLRITTQITGWAEVTGTYQPFATIDKLAQDIGLNGEAYWYDNKGMQEGIYQKLTGADGSRMELFIMDFGADTNAAKVFNEIVSSQVSNKAALDDYPLDMVVVQDNGNSAIVYAHFKRFFFKLTLTDYNNSLPNATSAALLFLDFYKGKFGK